MCVILCVPVGEPAGVRLLTGRRDFCRRQLPDVCTAGIAEKDFFCLVNPGEAFTFIKSKLL